MSKAQHTPGPWTIEEYGDEECPALVLHSDSETRICFMATPGSKGDPARITADAHLIVTAPDLLSLVKRWAALDGGSWHPDRHATNKAELLAETRDAIAKAEGASTTPFGGEKPEGRT